MGSKITGVAVIFGFSGSVAFTGAGTFVKNSGDVSSDIQVDELTDDDNEIISLCHSKERWNFNLLFTPRGATGTNTLANAALSLAPPAVAARVTLTLFKLAALNTADWVYTGGWKLAFTKNGLCTYSLTISRSPNNDLSVPVS